MGQNSAGRPTKYEGEQTDKKALSMASNGFTIPQIAGGLGVAASTVNLWLKTYPTFSEALNAGREAVDRQVEKSLFQRAMGYEHPEEKIFCNNGEIVRAATTKKYPPDVTACIFWLKNRMPAEWRDRVTEANSDTPEPVRVTIVVKDGKVDSD